MTDKISLKCKCGNKTFYHTWIIGNIWNSDGEVVRDINVDSDDHFWCEKCEKQVWLSKNDSNS